MAGGQPSGGVSRLLRLLPFVLLLLIGSAAVLTDLTTEFDDLPVQINKASVAYPSSFRVFLASGPTNITSNGTYTVTVAVDNTTSPAGTLLTAGNFTTADGLYRISGSGTSALTWTLEPSGTEIGRVYTLFPFSLSATTAGSISLIAKADVLNAVDEAYEDNNAAVSAAIPTATTIIPFQPTLRYGSLIVQTLNDTSQHIVSFTIQNIGNFDAVLPPTGSFLVRLSVNTTAPGSPVGTALALYTPASAPADYSAVLNNDTLITFAYTGTNNINRNAVTFQAYLSTLSVGSIDLVVDVDTENALVDSVPGDEVASQIFPTEDIAIVANSTFPVETITDTTYRNGIINITNIGPFGYTVSNGTFKVAVQVDEATSVPGVFLDTAANRSETLPAGYVLDTVTDRRVVYRLSGSSITPTQVLLPFRLRATISGVVNITIVLDVDQVLPSRYRATSSTNSTRVIPAPLTNLLLAPAADNPSTISLTSLSAFFVNVTYAGEPAYLGSNAFRVQFSVISQPLGGTATLSAPATLPICEPPPTAAPTVAGAPTQAPTQAPTMAPSAAPTAVILPRRCRNASSPDYALSPFYQVVGNGSTILSFEWTGGNILNSNAAAELGFNIIGNILGSLQIRATVDSLSAVRETSESDNSLLINTNLDGGRIQDLVISFPSVPVFIRHAGVPRAVTFQVVLSDNQTASISQEQLYAVSMTVRDTSPAGTTLSGPSFTNEDGTWDITGVGTNRLVWTLKNATGTIEVATTKFNFTVRATNAGLVSLVGSVDIFNAIAETLETNNDLSTSIPTATDVVPFSVLFSTVTFKDTAPVPFSLTFQNMGTFAGLVADPSVSPFRVSIAVDPSSPANTVISAAGISQPAGYSVVTALSNATYITYAFSGSSIDFDPITLLATVTATSTGIVRLVATIDVNSILVDSVAGNGVLSSDIYTDPSKLSVVGFYSLPAITSASSNVTAYINVTNSGPFAITLTPGSDFLVDVAIASSSVPGVAIYPPSTAASLPSGYEVVTALTTTTRVVYRVTSSLIPVGLAAVPFLIRAEQAGTVVLTVRADVDGVVSEVEKADNTGTLSIPATTCNVRSTLASTNPSAISVGEVVPLSANVQLTGAPAHIPPTKSFRVTFNVSCPPAGGQAILLAPTTLPAQFGNVSGSGTRILTYTYTGSNPVTPASGSAALTARLVGSTAGPVDVMVIVDSDNALVESNEQDNTNTITVNLQMASLVVRAVGPAGGLLTVDTDTDLTLSVVNDGPGSVFSVLPGFTSPSPYTIRLAVASSPPGSTVTLTPVSISNGLNYSGPTTSTGAITYSLLSTSTVPASTLTTIVARLRTDTPGPITISATADSELGVLEVDRNDNSAALGLLAITPQPDLAVTVTSSPPVLNAAGTAVISFQVTNIGSAASVSGRTYIVTAAIEAGSPIDTTIAGAKVNNYVDVSSAVRKTITYTFSGGVLGAGLATTFNITVGSRTTNSPILVSLRADGNNVIGEFSKTNNFAVVSVQPRTIRLLSEEAQTPSRPHIGGSTRSRAASPDKPLFDRRARV